MITLEDYLHPFKAAYRTSPEWLKNTLGRAYSYVPKSVRYGRLLPETTVFLERSQWWRPDELRDYQWQQVRRLLDHAYQHVPYYRRTWAEAGIKPADIRCLEDMAYVPLLTKEQVRVHKAELVAENYRDRLLSTNTGGSTGQPLQLYWERGRTRSLERAFMWRQWRWAGFEYGQRTAVLRGQTVREGIVHFDPIDNHLFLSGFNLSESTAPAYLAALRKFRPVSIQAYPAAITLLANYMKRHGEAPIAGLRAILAGSETLYPAQRALLEEVFGCRVYSWYGHAESVCLAGGCDRSDLYHVYGEYGYVELVNGGSPVAWMSGAKGEIVGTGFNNWAMPLIRYCTADIAEVGPESCSCGRPYPLWSRIEGRRQEYVVSAEGRQVPLTAFIFGQHYRAFEKIVRIQIFQDMPGAFTVRLVVAPDWTRGDERELRDDMVRAIGSGWQIRIEYTESIELTNSGKHRFVIQKLRLTNEWSGDITV